MLPASNRGAGQNLGFPDVCLTPAPPAPPVPVPYPNIAMNAQAVGFSPVVKVSGVNALNLGSTIPMTSGDEGGVSHATVKGPGKYTMGNPIVSIDKLPAIHLACPTTGNNMNNPLGVVAVPSAVNVLYCYAGGSAGSSAASLDERELDALAVAMSTPEVVAERLPSGVVRLAIGCFAPGLVTEVRRKLAAIGPDVVALVLDLRGCPGGDLDAALDLAAELAPRGDSRVTLVEPDGERLHVERRARAGLPHAVVALVDRGTASAAEVLVALLRASGRALLLGRRTCGKNSAQRVWAAPGANLRVEVARWEVDGVEVAGGIAPDHELPEPRDDAEADRELRTAWAFALRG